MQQRRGTAAQWTAANPTLAAGEIGFETDTNKFKMGNGTNAWSTLVYFTNNTALETLLAGDYPATLDTLNEIAAALGDDPTFFTTVATNLSTHAADTTSVHGITNTALLATTAGVAAAISGHDQATTGVHGINNTALLAIASEVADDISDAITAHNDDTLLVHGIANTAELVTTAILSDAITDATVDQSSLAGTGLTWDAESDSFIVDLTVMATKEYSDGALSTHQSDTTNVHGIPNTASLATQTNVSDAITAQAAITTTEIGTHNSDTTSVHGIADTGALATKTYADDAVSTHNTDTTNVHGIADTAALATTSATATAIGTAVSAHNDDTTNVHGIADTSLLATTADVAAVTKTSLGLGNVDNTADASKPVSTAQSTAIATAKSEAIADATAQVNALLTGAPAALNTLDELAAALGDDANFAATVTTSLGLKVDSLTPISQKTASYTLSSLTERDDLIEMGSASAITLSIPTDATLNYPIGTSIDILQTGAGQVTIAAVTPGTTTVNATPGLKLRTTWSSCTLFKRAANTWVVYGDLTA